MGTEVTVKKPELVANRDIAAIVPRTVEEAHRLAGLVIQAGLCPDSYRHPQTKQPDQQMVLTGIMKALEVGLPPLTGLSSIAIINGRPSIWGDGATALAQNSGYISDIKVERTLDKPVAQIKDWPDEYGYRVSITRSGHGGGTYVGEFTVGDAKRANLWLSHKRQPWILYPDRMLFNRARAFALRDGFADALAGLAIREEIEDIPQPAPEAVDAKFLDKGLEAPAEPAGELEPETPPAAQDAEIVTEGAPEPADDGFDYVGHFKQTIKSLATKKDVELFWENSEATRRQRSEDEQRQMAAIYADHYAAVKE